MRYGRHRRVAVRRDPAWRLQIVQAGAGANPGQGAAQQRETGVRGIMLRAGLRRFRLYVRFAGCGACWGMSIADAAPTPKITIIATLA